MLDSFIAISVAISLFSSVTNICINFYMTANANEAHDYFNAFFILLNGVLSIGVFLTCGILINNKVSWMDIMLAKLIWSSRHDTAKGLHFCLLNMANETSCCKSISVSKTRANLESLSCS